VLVHGLEGSSRSGYMVSLAATLLTHGFTVHRMNIRTCGGTEFQCRTLYHAGLTTDLFAYLAYLDRERRTPVYLVGFSLGGNMALKLAGELGPDAGRLLAGVAAVCTPLDLKACSLRLNARANYLYQWWFLRSMRTRLKRRAAILGPNVAVGDADIVKSVYELDDRITGPAFGFHGADHYYETQSALGFLDAIRVPTLLIQSQDDPLVPFEVCTRPVVRANRRIRLLTPEAGGHIGFLSRSLPRFWVDGVICRWIQDQRNEMGSAGV